jgi:cysteinyl-tRNA synthetase
LALDLASVSAHVAPIDGRFGVVEPGARIGPNGDFEADINRKIEARQKARAEKNFELADEIRQELLRAGIVLEDTKEGIRWKRVGPPKP